MAGTLPKPQLRNLLMSRMRLHVPLAVLVSVGVGFAFKIFVRDARRDRIAEFYRYVF